MKYAGGIKSEQSFIFYVENEDLEAVRKKENPPDQMHDFGVFQDVIHVPREVREARSGRREEMKIRYRPRPWIVSRDQEVAVLYFGSKSMTPLAPKQIAVRLAISTSAVYRSIERHFQRNDKRNSKISGRTERSKE